VSSSFFYYECYYYVNLPCFNCVCNCSHLTVCCLFCWYEKPCDSMMIDSHTDYPDLITQKNCFVVPGKNPTKHKTLKCALLEKVIYFTNSVLSISLMNKYIRWAKIGPFLDYFPLTVLCSRNISSAVCKSYQLHQHVSALICSWSEVVLVVTITKFCCRCFGIFQYIISTCDQ